MKMNIDAYRLLARETGIPYEKIKNAQLTSDEWIELTHVAAKLVDEGILIDKLKE